MGAVRACQNGEKLSAENCINLCYRAANGKDFLVITTNSLDCTSVFHSSLSSVLVSLPAYSIFFLVYLQFI